MPLHFPGSKAKPAVLLLALLLTLTACGAADITDEPTTVVTEESTVATVGMDMTGVDRTDTEVGGGYHDSLEWLRHWSGDWYGWWRLTEGTGLYADMGDGVWDACARIEAYENMFGYMELWDSDGSYDSLVAEIDVSFANPDDSQYGVMCCWGGQFLGNTLEEGTWYVNPEQLTYGNSIAFSGDYENEYGSFSYHVLLLPWGALWDDLGEETYPARYYDWYLPLVEADASMPDTIG